MDANKRNELNLDDDERRSVVLGHGLKVAACVVVCGLLTMIGMSAVEPATPVVGTLPPAASLPAPLEQNG